MSTPPNARRWPHAVNATAQPSTMVWGHRGASRAELQNSPAAFERALALGAHGVELDVRRTADDVLVVHHDADLTDGRFIVHTAAVDLPDYVPTLAWVLDLYRDSLVNIEVKSVAGEPDFEAAYPVVDLLLATLAESDPTNRHIVTSFDQEVVRRIRDRSDSVSTGLITYEREVTDDLAPLAADGHAAVMADVRLVDEDLVASARASGLFLGVWTVNDPADMRTMFALGVDAIMTDLPDVAFTELAGLTDQA